MKETSWILIDTETTGLVAPITVVELAAQRMRGWERDGPSFRRLLNQNADVPPEASRVHGYTREILERDGEPAKEVYRDFSAYVRNFSLVAYNLDYDLNDVLKPEWARLGVMPIGTAGFCALRLAQRLLDPVPAGNCKLQTLRQYYRLPERGAHTAMGDVDTVADLMKNVLKPIAESKGLASWEDICAYTESEWFPSRIAFGKFKGRNFLEARTDGELRGWLEWLTNSKNERTARMGRWYLGALDRDSLDGFSSTDFTTVVIDEHGGESEEVSSPSRTTIVVYRNPEIEQLRILISTSRARLAELEAQYTTDRRAVDVTRATIFNALRKYYQERDRIRLIINYRRKFLEILIRGGEEEAAETAGEYQKAREQSDAEYEQAAASSESRRSLTGGEQEELKRLWKKLVRLYHPDRFAGQPDKIETYSNLTSEINRARDNGDIDVLRDIANDPSGFILRKGWSFLDFSDSAESLNLKRLLETLQIEILATMGLINDLRESADYCLLRLSEKQPGLLDEVAAQQAREIEEEITALAAEAEKLDADIKDLTSAENPEIR